MGTAETPPFFFPPLPFPGLNIGDRFWRQLQPTGREDFNAPVFKKLRHSDYMMNPSHNLHLASGLLPPPPVPPIPPQNYPFQSHKVSSLFFKTKLCTRFRLGSCPYGENCSFAHGPEELRRAPPNRPGMAGGCDDERLAGTVSDRYGENKPKICWKYYNGEVCPYGERCTFAHVKPGNLKENPVINVGTPEVTPSVERRGINGTFDLEANGSSGSGGDGNGVLHKAPLWKTKMCHKWEQTGDCPFGEKCLFAHGTTELKKLGGLGDVETKSVAAYQLPSPAETIPPNKTGHPSKRKRLMGLMGLRKMSNIYADWIEDTPPP